MTETIVKITLTAVDGYSVEIIREYLNVSGLLAGIVEDFDTSDPIPISQVMNKEYMDLLVEYLTNHAGNKDIKELDKPIKANKTLVEHGASEWDAKFINKLSIVQLQQLTNVANFLDMKALLDLCCAKFAMLISTMKIDELKKHMEPITSGEK